MASPEQDTVSDGPYRSAPLTPPPGRRRWPYVVALLSLSALCAYWFNGEDGERSPTLADVPSAFVHHLSEFPAELDGLPMATPLGPLLAADRPAGLAIQSPAPGATRLMRGQSLWVRFNRPMVEGYEVGHALDESPIVLVPRVGGSFTGVAQWTTRSTLRFTPDENAWRRNREAEIIVREGLASLDGSIVEEEFERVLVVDATPRFVTGGGAVMAGAPLPMYFDERVHLGELTREMFAYEIGGGSRNMPFALVARGFDARGFRVDVRPRRALEAGAQIGVAIAPRWGRHGYERPLHSIFRLQPPPQVTGVDCDVRLSCDYPAVPGRVVDIGPTLRVATSEVIASPSASQVRVAPPLRGIEVTLAEGGRLLEVSGEWEPDQVYEVHIRGLRTASGDALRRLPALAVRSAGHAPQVVVSAGHFVWEPHAATHIYFRGVNLTSANAEYQAVAHGDELRAALDPTSYARAMERVAEAGEPGPTAARLSLAALAPEARPNRWDEGRVRWRTEARDSSMAIVGFRPVARSEVGVPGAVPSVFAQQTDLATTLRIVRDGVLLWVTSLTSAEPVAGASVTLAERADEVLATGETDAAGVLWLPLPDRVAPERLAALVTHGGDRAVVVTQRGAELGPARFHVASSRTVPPEGQPVASVLTDRGAYRPREIVRVRAVVRRVNRRHLSAFDGEEVLLRVTSGGNDRPLAERRLRTNDHGTVSTSFTLPTRVPLGTYAVQVVRPAVPPSEESQGTGEVLLGSGSIRVASFRQPSFRVDIVRSDEEGAAVADESSARAGEALRFEVTPVYLFGAPVSQGRLRWSLVREGAAPYPQRFAHFHFGPTDESPHHGTVSQGQLGLGDPTLRVEAAPGLEATHRERLVFEAEAEDRSGQATSAHADMVLYPAALEVGLRRGDAWVPHGEPVPVEVVVIDNRGEPVAGRPVRARVRREGWHSYWEWARGSGSAGYRVRRERERELVHSCELTSTADPTTDPSSCRFEPSRPGTYLLEVETEDEGGRRSLATRRLYVAGPDDVPDRDPIGTSIALTPTHRRWQAGETAALAFESPWENAQALISVEQEGVLYYERRRVGAGGQVVEIPLTDMMVPNVFVAVTLVRARVGEPQAEHDILGPDLRFGMAELEVMPATDRLEVAVTAPETGNPGEDIELSVEVRGPDGPVQTELALWVVDEGSLRLTDYQTPDPTRGLFPLKPADFRWNDSRRSLVSRLEPDSWRAGGGGGGGDGQRILRQDDVVLEPNPLWLPHLRTDAHGRATVRFRLPERSTEYRVMALALDDGVAWGKDQSNIVVSRPVVLQDALPRFVTRGDTFEAAVFVHNVSDQPVSPSVVLEVGGHVVATESVDLAPGEQLRVARELTASGMGALEVRFRLTGEHSTSVERTIAVAPRARWVRSHAFGVVSGARGGEDNGPVALNLPRAERGAVNVSVAAHPFVGVRSIVDGLGRSRWGGTRAYAATLAGLAAQLTLTEAMPSPLRTEVSTDALRSRGQDAVDRLLSLQLHSGAFGRWSADGAADPWETAFATQALLSAARAGLDVPLSARSRALEWLAAAASRATFGDSYGQSSPGALAYALRVLTEGGRPESERAAALYEQRDRLGPDAMAHLAMAFAPGDSRRTTLTLEAAAIVLVDRDDEKADPSLLRHWARQAVVLGPVLEAAASMPAAHSSLGPIAAEVLALVDPSHAFGWGTSVDAAFGARALAAYAAVFERNAAGPTILSVDGAPIEARYQTDTAAFVQLPGLVFDGEEHSLEFAPAEDGLAFFAIDGEWAAPVSEADDVARGRRVALHRHFETTAGRELSAGDTVELGELIRVRLFVFTETSPPPFTMVHDPLGGGFEAVQRQFATSPRASVEAMLGMGPDDDVADPRGHYALRSARQVTHRQLERNAAQFYFDRMEAGLQEFTYVVRATTVGTFTLPPAQIEALRDTAFLGRSTASSLVVRARGDDPAAGADSDAEAATP